MDKWLEEALKHGPIGVALLIIGVMVLTGFKVIPVLVASFKERAQGSLETRVDRIERHTANNNRQIAVLLTWKDQMAEQFTNLRVYDEQINGRLNVAVNELSHARKQIEDLSQKAGKNHEDVMRRLDRLVVAVLGPIHLRTPDPETVSRIVEEAARKREEEGL